MMLNVIIRDNITEKLNKYNVHSKSNDELFLNNIITSEEIYKIFKNLQTGKAGGQDGIQYEHLKYGCSLLYDYLSIVFNYVVEKENILPCWNRE